MTTHHFALLFLCTCTSSSIASRSVFDWFGRDAFDVIMEKMSSVSRSNCAGLSAAHLQLPKAAVSMVPQSNLLLDVETRVFRNRSCLLSMHDMALSRSYFLSLMFKMTNTTTDFWKQPDWEYFYFRQAGIVNSFPHCINSSGVYFDYRKAYPNWVTGVALNNTINFFGPRVFRYDDTRSAWLREPTIFSARAWDIGAGPNRNYTNSRQGFNPWYTLWLPDKLEDKNLKGSFTIGMKYSSAPGQWDSNTYIGHSFFGPPLTRLQDSVNLPVQFTVPYFDCGRRNKWMVSAVAPIVDALPRYRREEEIREFGESVPTFVGTASMDTDWQNIDINPCPEGEGNPGPNIFAGIARCKPTTMCQPLTGWGFARGSYVCVCRPGYRYPSWQNGPYQGSDIELATEEEHKNGFDCLKIDYMKVVPSVIERNSSKAYDPSLAKQPQRRSAGQAEQDWLEARNKIQTATVKSNRTPRKVHIEPSKQNQVTFESKSPTKRSVQARFDVNFEEKLRQKRKREVYGPAGAPVQGHSVNTEPEEHLSRPKRSSFQNQVTDGASVQRMEQIFRHIEKVSQSRDCTKLPPDQLVLPGDVGYGAKEQFQYQARTANAMAHYLSATYENLVPKRQNWGAVHGGRLPNKDLLMADVLSQVMADHKIRSFGVWFDRYQYQEPVGDDLTAIKRELFAPYAFQDGDQYKVVDMAGDPDVGAYLKADWFRKTKKRWMNTGSGVRKHKLKPRIRVDKQGLAEANFFYDSYYYHGPKFSHGYWSNPYFACNGYVNDWVITFAAPFFRMDPLSYGTVKFIGVVTVDIKLSFLDISQCSQPFWVANAFKNTAYCDHETTHCVPVEGKRFTKGAYRCLCKQGYEYPFIENAWFFDGAAMESEHRKKQKGIFNRYDHMKCRIGRSSSLRASTLLYLMTLILLAANYTGNNYDSSASA